MKYSMRKLALFLGVALLAASSKLVFGAAATHYNFRGAVLGSEKSAEMIPHTDINWHGAGAETEWSVGVDGSKKKVEVCERKDDKKAIGDLKVDRIEYYYIENKLFKVMVWSNPFWAKRFDELLTMKFRAPYRNAPVEEQPYWTGVQYVKHAVIKEQTLDLTLIERWISQGVGDTIIQFADVDLLKEHDAAVEAEAAQRQRLGADRKRSALKDF